MFRDMKTTQTSPIIFGSISIEVPNKPKQDQRRLKNAADYSLV